jgi:hypothetical protein
MNQMYLLMDSRGTDDGVTYGIWAAFSDVDNLMSYYYQLIVEHPKIKEYLYTVSVDMDPAPASDTAFILGDEAEVLAAFTSEEDALDWADDWFDENPTGDLYGFVVYLDPKYE